MYVCKLKLVSFFTYVSGVWDWRETQEERRWYSEESKLFEEALLPDVATIRRQVNNLQMDEWQDREGDTETGSHSSHNAILHPF